MLSTEQLKKIFQEIFEGVKTNLMRDKELMPVLFILGMDGIEGMGIIQADMNDDDVKEGVAEAIREMYKKHNVCGYLLVSEAWMVSREKDQLKDTERPSQCADRREVVQGIGQYMDIQIMAFMPFNRVQFRVSNKKTEEQIVCNELEISENFTTEGKFANLL